MPRATLSLDLGGGGTQQFTAPPALIIPQGVEYHFDCNAGYKAVQASYLTTPPSGTPTTAAVPLPGLTLTMGGTAYSNAYALLTQSGKPGGSSNVAANAGAINLSQGSRITGGGLIFTASFNINGATPPAYMPFNCLWDGINFLADTLAGVGTDGVTGIAIVLNSADQAVVDGPLIVGFDTAVAVVWTGDARIRNLRLQNKNQIVYDNCHDAIHSDGTLHLFTYMQPSQLFGGVPFTVYKIANSPTIPGICRLTVTLDQPLPFYDAARYHQHTQVETQSIKVSVSNVKSGPQPINNGPCGVWWGKIVTVTNPVISGGSVSTVGTLVLDLADAPTEDSYVPARGILNGGAASTTGTGAAWASGYGTLSAGLLPKLYIFGFSQCPGTALSVTNTDGGAFSIAEWFNSAGGIYLGPSCNHVTIGNTGQDGNAGSADQHAFTVWFDNSVDGCAYTQSSAQSSFTGVRMTASNTSSVNQLTNKVIGSHINGNGAGYQDSRSSGFGIGFALDLRTGSLILDACTANGDMRVQTDSAAANRFTHLDIGVGDYSTSNFQPVDANGIPTTTLDPGIVVYCASGAPPAGLPAQYLAASNTSVAQQKVNLNNTPSITVVGGTTWLYASQTGSLSAATLALAAPPQAASGFPLTITSRGTIGALTLTGALGWSNRPLAPFTSIRLLWDSATTTWIVT